METDNTESISVENLYINKGYANSDEFERMKLNRCATESENEKNITLSENTRSQMEESHSCEIKDKCFGYSEQVPQENLKEDEKKADEDENAGEKLPPVRFFELFRFSTCCDKALIIFAFIIAILSGCSMPAIMIIFGKVVDKFIYFDISNKNMTGGNMSPETFLKETATLCMYNALFGCTFLLTNYIMVSFFSITAANQALRIRCKFMESVLKQDIAWYDTNQTGDFASRITGDLTRIQEGIGEKVGICVCFLSSCFICIGCGIYYGWKLALVILSSTPVLTIAMAIMAKIQAAASSEELQAYGTAGAVAEEVLSSIRTVVAFGGERKEIQRYEHCLVPARKKGIKRGLMTGIGAALMWFCVFAGYSLAFWYGVKLIVEERDLPNPTYTGGTLIIIFFNVLSASMYVGQTAPYFEAFALARGAAAKIFSIIDREPLIDSNSDGGLKPSSLEGYIELEDVYFNYPARPTVPILRGLSLIVEPGETVALVGPSGCGKSTVIQLILRFYDVDTGSIKIDGNNVKELNVGWLRDHIGLVGQEPVLFSTTIEENIKYGKLNATSEDVVKAAKLANVHDFIDSLPLKYKTLVGERGTQLSGGQKQRIAIARALVKNPKILLLDEATSALDNESEAVVQSALDEASVGRTTIVVAHRLSTIRTADKIMVIDAGVVKEIGTHDELMQRKGIYCQLVQTQIKETEEKSEGEENGTEDLIEDSNVFKRRTSVLSSLSRNSEDARHHRLLRQISILSTDSEKRPMSPSSLIRPQLPAVRGHLEKQLSTASGIKIQDAEVEDDVENVSLSQTRLLKICAPEWPYALIGTISALMMGFHFPLFGILFGEILGVLSEEPEKITEKNSFFCLLFLLMAITSFVLTFLQISMFSVAGEKLTSRLRKLVFENIITQDMSFFDNPKNSVGSLCTRLTSDASSVQGATGSRVSLAVQALSTLTTSVVIALYYNPKIGSVTLAYVPLVLLGTYLEFRVVSGHMASEKVGMEAASKTAVEAIENIRTVASLHQEELFYSQFREALLEPHRKSRLKSHVRGLAYGFAQAIQAFAYATALYYGSVLVAQGEISYADMLKVIESVIIGAMIVGQGIAFTPDYQTAKIAAVRIFRLLDLKPEIDAFSDKGIVKDVTKGYVGFNKVHFNYPNRSKVKILRDLSLEIEPSKTVALVGSSGCGKSTCIQLIERFYDAQKGELVIDNENVKDLNIAKHRSHVGLVSQEPVLFSCSLAENIAYGDNTRSVDMNEIIEAAKQANIHNFITSLPQGYETPVGDKGTQLSGGQKQRVAIARALLRNPKILLLDEATSALDAESEKIVQEALDKASSGRTCLTIAHRLTTIQNADCIMVFHKGQIVEKGTHQELLNIKGHYYNLHNTQGTAH